MAHAAVPNSSPPTGARGGAAAGAAPAAPGASQPSTAATTAPTGADPAVAEPGAGARTLALIMATLGFGLNFWAWALISPLGPIYVEKGLAADAALMVAVPVLVGSVGRILVGAMTDRFGGRLMMPAVSLITVVPVLFLGFIGQYTFVTLIVGGFFLGIAGTSFAIGVPYVNSWFPPKSRGSAIGIYGMGMGGTAIAAFTTVPLFRQGDKLPFIVVAIVLVVYAIVAYLLMRNAPGWAPVRRNLGEQLLHTAGISLTWQACYLYALSFGGYVAFSVYLPTYLINAYGLEKADASMRMAGFVIAAVIMRPVGGILSDRLGAAKTLMLSYLLVIVCAVVLIFDPALMPVGTICFITMAAGLGLGSGATFALVAQTSEPSQVGAITGFVGAAGGLGGFVPPLLLGRMWQASGSYTFGLVLLTAATIIALGIAWYVGFAAARRARRGPDGPGPEAPVAAQPTPTSGAAPATEAPVAAQPTPTSGAASTSGAAPATGTAAPSTPAAEPLEENR